MRQHSIPLTVENHASAETLNLGTFEGFNTHEKRMISYRLSAHDVIHWAQDRDGKAVFQPSGNHPGVSFVFRKRTMTGMDLLHLVRLLGELQSDSIETFMKIGHALKIGSCRIAELTADHIKALNFHAFVDSGNIGLWNKAAYELFELCYPKEYAAWKDSACDCLIFDTERFLNSPAWSVEQVFVGNGLGLIVSPQ